MKPVLVGSRALAYWLPEFKCRDNADWDVICSPTIVDQIKDGPLRVEAHTFDELNNYRLCNWYSFSGPPVNINGIDCQVLSLPGLAVMKRSHLWRVHQFEKHITMYHKYLKEYLPSERGSYWEEVGNNILKHRIKLTMEAFPQNNNPLNKSNMEFFDDKVEKKFDHDWLHELVAHGDRPMFEKLKKPEKFDKAWCERDLWEELPYEDKLMCLSEEAHVIACERFMIPSDWTEYQKPSYFRAVNKVCTTLTAGSFRDFAIDNFPELIALYDENKFKRVKEKTYDN